MIIQYVLLYVITAMTISAIAWLLFVKRHGTQVWIANSICALSGIWIAALLFGSAGPLILGLPIIPIILCGSLAVSLNLFVHSWVMHEEKRTSAGGQPTQPRQPLSGGRAA